MRDAEVAFVFGDAPDSKPGALKVMPGRIIATRSNGDKGWGSHGHSQLRGICFRRQDDAPN